MTENEKLREQINQIIEDLGLTIGWRQHFALAVGCHVSSLNNALNGHRSGARETEILKRLRLYLSGFNRYYQKRAVVNTKMH